MADYNKDRRKERIEAVYQVLKDEEKITSEGLIDLLLVDYSRRTAREYVRALKAQDRVEVERSGTDEILRPKESGGENGES